MEQILADAFSSHTEPVWVLEVRRDHDRWLGSNAAITEMSAVVDRLQAMLSDFNAQMNTTQAVPQQLGRRRADEPLTWRDDARQG